MIKPVKKHLPFVLTFLFFQQAIHAQVLDTAVTSLKQLLEVAEKNYPLLKAKALEIQAAQKGVRISKNSLLPALDASYQVNYATYNNITGMAWPQFLVPISGPPSTSNNMSGVFGSAASLLLNWQPVTFGQRQAQVNYAESGVQYATADAQNEIFQHKVKVINAWLDVITANELVKVYEENIRRTETNLAVARTLVINGIKPGVDSALLRSEISKARVDWLNSRKIKEQALIALSQLTATDKSISITDTSYFYKLPATTVIADTVSNPLIAVYNADIEMSRSKKKLLSRTAMPTLGAWSTLYARGSGIEYNGTIKSTEGLGFQRYNYGVGLQLSVPILQSVRLKPQLQQQDLLIQSGREKLQELSLQVQKQKELADTALNTALAVAHETPVFYESASFAYKALVSRYQSGLANFADLIQGQYGLVKAQTDNKTAYMAVWKALLFKAAVTGDLTIFLNQVN